MSFSISWRSHLLTWLQQPHKSFFSLYACLDCTFSSCADETQIPVSSLLSRLQDIYKCLSDLTFPLLWRSSRERSLWCISIHLSLVNLMGSGVRQTWVKSAPLISHATYQYSSVAQSCLTLCDPVDCSKPGLPVHHQLLEFTQTHVHWVGDALQLSHPLSSPSPAAFNLSQHQDLFFSNEPALRIRWPKYWNFSFSISPSNENSGLISLRIDWFDLAVWESLKSLLQHHSSKASFLRCSAFFMVQLSHPYTW